MIKWEANCPEKKDSRGLPSQPAARRRANKVEKRTFEDWKHKNTYLKKKGGGRKKKEREEKTQLISPSRLKEKPDLEMEWLTFGVVWRELLQAVFVHNV